MTVAELLADESKWTKRAAARDLNDREVSIYSPDAVKFCLIGAIMRCYPGPYEVRAKIYANMDSAASIAILNDDLKTTFADIKALVDKAGI